MQFLTLLVVINFGCKIDGLVPGFVLFVFGAMGVVTTGIAVLPSATTFG